MQRRAGIITQGRRGTETVSKTEHLIEQQIIKHEAHLKHIDELFERARQGNEEQEEPDPLLTALEAERNELASVLRSMQGAPPESWQEAADARFGPLAVWNIVARLLENLIERAEKGH
jgi:hypothetical protein